MVKKINRSDWRDEKDFEVMKGKSVRDNFNATFSGNPSGPQWNQKWHQTGTSATATWPSQPIDGMIKEEAGKFYRYDASSMTWQEISLTRGVLQGIDLDRASADAHTIKKELFQRVMYLEELHDGLEGKARSDVDDAIHYMREAIYALERIGKYTKTP